jgi:hypothetical protein
MSKFHQKPQKRCQIVSSYGNHILPWEGGGEGRVQWLLGLRWAKEEEEKEEPIHYFAMHKYDIYS